MRIMGFVVAVSLLLVAGACVPGETCYPSGAFEGCYTDEELKFYQEAPKVVVSPAAAMMAVGQSGAFKVEAGRNPIHTEVTGCLGVAVACTRTRMSGGNLPFDKMFDIEWTGSTIVVTFIHASLKPTNVRLEVWGSDGWGRARKTETLAVIPLTLSY